MENNSGFAIADFSRFNISPKELTEEERAAIENRKYISKVIEEAISIVAEEVLVRLKTDIDQMDIDTLLKTGMTMTTLQTSVDLIRSRDPRV